MTYVVLICARNEEKYIASCLSALYFQTMNPELVVVVDDGSQDETTQRAQEFSERLSLKVLRNPDRGFSAVTTYLMADPYNLGLEYLSKIEWDFLLILGADTSIPPNYVEKLYMAMTPQLGAISGRYSGIPENYAAATGRFIRRSIIKKLGDRLPRNYSWESSVTHCAEYMGYEKRSFPVPIYNLRPPGQRKRSYVGAGRAVKELGYYWPNVLNKSLIALKKGKPLMALQILYGYFTHKPQTPLPEWAQYIKERQTKAFKQKIRRIIPW